MTEQITQPIDPNIGDRFVDTSYVNNAPPSPRKRAQRVPPGAYFLKGGSIVVTFVPEKSGESKKDGTPYTFPARIEVQPNFSIVSAADGSEEYAGAALNQYYRLTSEPVKLGRTVQNYSTLSACLDAFGLSMPESGSEADIRAVAEQLSGLISIRPIYVSYQGSFRYKPFVQMPDGSYLRFNEKAFRLTDAGRTGAAKYKAAGGEWAPCGFLLDPDDDTARRWTLDTPSENVSQKKIWANIEPTESGFLAND